MPGFPFLFPFFFFFILHCMWAGTEGLRAPIIRSLDQHLVWSSMSSLCTSQNNNNKPKKKECAEVYGTNTKT
ncbi:MAG: hypothetical protein JOS17DRAFT_750375 [Linnemannia elongata]|nr:MAG: hypothetical protein JOS17DRAFT_750375 [Linnemannia elongata]